MRSKRRQYNESENLAADAKLAATVWLLVRLNISIAVVTPQKALKSSEKLSENIYSQYVVSNKQKELKELKRTYGEKRSYSVIPRYTCSFNRAYSLDQSALE